MRTENQTAAEIPLHIARPKNMAKKQVREWLSTISEHCPDEVVRAVIAGGLYSLITFVVEEYGAREAYELLQNAADAIASDTELLSPKENRHV